MRYPPSLVSIPLPSSHTHTYRASNHHPPPSSVHRMYHRSTTATRPSLRPFITTDKAELGVRSALLFFGRRGRRSKGRRRRMLQLVPLLRNHPSLLRPLAPHPQPITPASPTRCSICATRRRRRPRPRSTSSSPPASTYDTRYESEKRLDVTLNTCEGVGGRGRAVRTWQRVRWGGAGRRERVERRFDQAIAERFT